MARCPTSRCRCTELCHGALGGASDFAHSDHMNQSTDLIGTGVAAREIGVAPSTFRRWVDSGLVPGVLMPSGQRRVRRADLDAVLQSTMREDQ